MAESVPRSKASRSTGSRRSTRQARPSSPRPSPKLRERADRVYRQLDQLYPDARCALDHDGPFQLLVATILSAQCTDVMVNKVTPALFRAYPTPADMAEAPLDEVEQLIRSTNFYRNKAKSIVGASRILRDRHDGQVPAEMDLLLELPGVARKTANVVLGNAFNINVGVVVDTHVSRLSQRLGFTRETTPERIEPVLMKLFPQERWTQLAHLLIHHGRQVCDARKPACEACAIADDCPRRGVKKTARA